MSGGVKIAATSRDPSAVTSVIRHTVRAGSESRYEAWFREVTAIAQTFPGHRGVDFIRPPKWSCSYTIVLHFDTREHLGRWLSSDARERLIAELKPYLESGRSGGDRPVWNSGSRHRTQSKSMLRPISSS